MIPFEEARKLLHSYITDSSRLKHLEECARFAQEVVDKINTKGKVTVDADFIKVCALLHDIGRSPQIDKTANHAYEGGILLRKLGLDKIAHAIETHGDAHERNEYLGNCIDLIPKTLEQKIIAYVDLHVGPAGKRFTPEARFKDVIERSKEMPHHLIPFEKSKPRMLELVKEIEALM